MNQDDIEDLLNEAVTTARAGGAETDDILDALDIVVKTLEEERDAGTD